MKQKLCLSGYKATNCNYFGGESFPYPLYVPVSSFFTACHSYACLTREWKEQVLITSITHFIRNKSKSKSVIWLLLDISIAPASKKNSSMALVTSTVVSIMLRHCLLKILTASVVSAFPIFSYLCTNVNVSSVFRFYIKFSSFAFCNGNFDRSTFKTRLYFLLGTMLNPKYVCNRG